MATGPRAIAAIDEVLVRQRGAVDAALVRNDAGVQHLSLAARDYLGRLSRATIRLAGQLDRDELDAAAITAGQVALLSRLVEQRVLCAAERRVAAYGVACAALEGLPEGSTPLALKRREQQASARRRGGP
jgi:hypothetical protein